MLGGVKVMRIDFNRICKLAGVSNNSSGGNLLSEGAEANKMDHPMDEEYDEAMMHEELPGEESDEGMKYEDDHPEAADEMAMKYEEADADEMVDVDIAELMSEIRRAKKLIKVNESKERSQKRRQQRIQENHLKRIIQKEVDSILSEIEEKDSSWVYGNKKPQHSRKGYTNHGRTLPGIGFGKKW